MGVVLQPLPGQEKVTRKNGFKASPENVVVSAGGLGSLLITLHAFVECGDEVLLPKPGWPNYLLQMACIGSKGVQYPLDPSNDFRIDFDALERLVTPRTKAIIVNSPSNPTGAVFPREDIERVVDFTRRRDLFLISDEVYEDIVFEGEHVTTGTYNDDGRIAVIFSFSKTYAVTGLRVGYVVCEKNVATLVAKINEAVVSCAPGISQRACLAALKGPQDEIAEMVRVYHERRDGVVEILRERGRFTYLPKGAFYTLIDITDTGMGSDEFTMELLRERKVAVAPGATFGAETYVRISLATNTDKLLEGTRKLCDFIDDRSS